MDKLFNYRLTYFLYPYTEKEKRWNAEISDTENVWGVGVENAVELGIRVPINIEREKTGSVIEKAFEMVPPPTNVILAVLDQNVDTLGALAVLDLKSKGHMFTETEIARIMKIAKESVYLAGRIWPGPRELPSMKNIWAGVGDIDIYLLSYYIDKGDGDIYDKVEVMKNYIKDNIIDGIIRTTAKSYRYKLVNNLQEGKIKFKKYGDIYLIKSEEEGALEIGHYLSPIIVLKTTENIIVSRYAPEYLDFNALYNDINLIENGWKIRNNILHSPVGKKSKIKAEAVVRLIQNNV